MFDKLISLIDSAPDEILSQEEPEYAAATKSLSWILLFFIVSFVTLGVVWWSGTHIPETQYNQLRVVDGKNQASTLYTFSLPHFSPERLQSWSSKALADTLTFNFTDVDQRLNAATVYYTPGASDSMRQAIAKQQIIEKVKGSRLSVALTPLSSPYIIKSFIIKSGGEKTLYWDIEAPVLLTYTGASTKEIKGMRVYLKIKQVPTTESPDGLAIAGFYVTASQLN